MQAPFLAEHLLVLASVCMWCVFYAYWWSVCVCIWGSMRLPAACKTSNALLSCSPLTSLSPSLSWSSLFKLHCLASMFSGSACLSPQMLGLQTQVFTRVLWAQTQTPCACTASHLIDPLMVCLFLNFFYVCKCVHTCGAGPCVSTCMETVASLLHLPASLM